MKTTICLLAGALGALAPAFAADPPAPGITISNGVLTAKLHAPDPEKGFYRGTRFDWAGVVASLERKGHNYFGWWNQAPYDPKLHDAITGPVDSFNAIGYEDTPVGGKFLRIGVGWLKRPDSPRMDNFHTYEIADGGKWTTKVGKDKVEFTHTLAGTYVYKKTLRLVKDSLVIEHSLKNTGKKTLETDMFNHDFFMLDNQPTGPDIGVKFSFEPKTQNDWRGPGEIQGKELVYKQVLPNGVAVSGAITGYGATAADQEFRVENRKTGVGVHQTGDRPLSRLYFWSIKTTVCPEAYVHVKVEPGKEERWKSAFEFY
jgi:hypothetical protein